MILLHRIDAILVVLVSLTLGCQHVPGRSSVVAQPITSPHDLERYRSSQHDSPRCDSKSALVLSGVQKISSEEAHILALYPTTCLYLPDLVELEPDAARILSSIPLDSLALHLSELSATTARVLASTASKNLVVMAPLTPETVRALSWFRGESLGLSELHDLDLDTLAVLVQSQSSMELQLSSLTPDVARVLSTLQSLSITGLKELSAASALELVDGPLKQLSLRHLSSLDVETAQVLADADLRYLSLEGLDTLPPKVLSLFSQSKPKFLNLKGLSQLELDTALRLVEAGPHLRVQLGVSQLTAESAAVIGPHLSRFSLDGLEVLEPEVAPFLVQSSSLELPALRTLSEKAARVLVSGSISRLSLGLPELSLDVARVLSDYSGERLELGLTQLTPDLARHLVGSSATHLVLDGLTALDVETAEVLIQAPLQYLSLKGLERLETGVAAQLKAADASMTIVLDGLRYYDAETLAVFVERSMEPKDPRVIRQLDVASAQHLMSLHVIHLPGLAELSPDTAAVLAGAKRVRLDGLTRISPASARALAAFEGSLMELGLTVLDIEIAQQLSELESVTLSLPRLNHLDDAVARVLLGADKAQLRLHLHGVWKASPALYRWSLEKRIDLAWDALSELTPEHAAVLLEFDARKVARFHAVKRLDRDTAEVLSQFSGKALALPSLEQMSPEAAGHLAQFQGEDLVLAIDTLDKARAEALAAFDGSLLELHIRGGLDAVTAKAIGQSQAAEIELTGLKGKLATEVAKGLAAFEGVELDLDVTELEGVETAEVLAQFGASLLAARALETRLQGRTRLRLPRLKLRNLRVLSPEAARALETFRGRIQFSELTIIHPESARLLVKHGMPQLGPRTTELDPETAAVIATYGGRRLELQQIEVLDAETAREIARFSGSEIWLTRVTTLTPEAAAALSTFSGEELLLSNLELTPEVAAALARFQGARMKLPSIRDPAIKKALEAYSGEVGRVR